MQNLWLTDGESLSVWHLISQLFIIFTGLGLGKDLLLFLGSNTIVSIVIWKSGFSFLSTWNVNSIRSYKNMFFICLFFRRFGQNIVLILVIQSLHLPARPPTYYTDPSLFCSSLWLCQCNEESQCYSKNSWIILVLLCEVLNLHIRKCICEKLKLFKFFLLECFNTNLQAKKMSQKYKVIFSIWTSLQN